MNNIKTVRWIFSKIGRSAWMIAALTVINVMLSAVSVRLALASKSLIDSAVSGAENIAKYGAVLAVLILFELFMQSLYSAVMVKTDGKVKIKIRTYVFNMLLKKDYRAVTEIHSGELLNRINNDTDVITAGIMTVIPESISIAAQILLSLAALYILDKYLAVMCVVAVPVIFAAACFYGRRIKPLHKKCQSTAGTMRSFMLECLQNLLVIKCFVKEEEATERGEALQEKNYRAVIRRNTLTIVGNILFYLILTCAFYFSMYRCTLKISAGVMTFGTLTAVLQLVGNIQSPLKSAAGILPQFYSSVASAERIMELESLKDDENVCAGNAKEMYEKLLSVDFINVSFKYESEPVLENAALSIKKGEFIAVRGESGIGKSTMFKLMTAVLSPDSGKVVFNTTDGEEAASSAWRGLFAYVPQTNMILSGTIYENIAFYNKNITEEQIVNAAKLACIYDFICSLPNGFNTVLGEKGAGLSEGQIQRVAIARALAADLPIILFDEATSSLDVETEEKVLKNLKMQKDKTVMVISHRPAVFELCDGIIEISDKKIFRCEK